MATTKVSALSALTTTDGNEELLINDGGTSKKVTIDNVLHDNSIRAEHYVDGSIATAHIADNAITSAKLGVDVIVAEDIANNAITVAELADNAVTTAKILDANVTTAKIVDDAVTEAKLANAINTAIAANTAKTSNATHTGDVTGATELTIASGAVETGMIADDAVTADKLANSINTEIAANTAKTSNATHTGEVTGATALTIADNVVDEANLKVSNTPTNGYFLQAQSSNTGGLTWAATSTSIADGSITTAKIADDAVTSAKLANSINTDIATGVTANTTANAALPKAGGTMTGEVEFQNHFAINDNKEIRVGSGNDLRLVHDGSDSFIKDEGTGNLYIRTTNGTSINLQGGTEDMVKIIKDGAVEVYHNGNKKFETTAAGATVTGTLTADLADNSIDSEHYVDGSIDSAHLASNSVTTAKINDGDVTTAKLAADCITAAKIGNDILNSEHYAAGSIDTEHIADLNVTGAKLSLDRRSSASTDDVYSGNTHDYAFYDADTGIRWYTANAEEMRLENDGDLHVDGDVIAFSTTVSDATLKYDINPVEFALEKINQLKGVSYKYKHNDRESAGLLAQDVEKVMPSAVKTKKIPLVTGDDKEYKTLHYDSMTAILVEAIKELTAKVKKLENK